MIPSRGSAIAGFSPHVAGAALRRVLASRLRRDREVRCDAGAAPATVSGEIATRSVLPDRVEASPRPVSAVLLPPLTLVLGGARSGKSRYAEALIEAAAPEAL